MITTKELRTEVVEELQEALRPLQRTVEDLAGLKDHIWHSHKGDPSVYHYQQKCRHPDCRSANRLYYHQWRSKK